MADGPGYQVPHRRRREQRTDYETRLELLKSGRPRAVIRRSNNHVRIQLVEYSPEGDETVASAASEHLSEHGWDNHTGNLPAAYLTGYLAGARAQEEGIDDAVVDIGLQNNQHSTRIYAAIKGLIDAGVHVNASEEVFPAERRLHGEHIDEHRDTNIADDVEDVKESIDGA